MQFKIKILKGIDFFNFNLCLTDSNFDFRCQFVFTMPKRLRIFFRYDRGLLKELPKLVWDVIKEIYQAVLQRDDTPYRKLRSRWAALIRKVYETDPLRCPKCQGEMKIIAFIERRDQPTWSSVIYNDFYLFYS